MQNFFSLRIGETKMPISEICVEPKKIPLLNYLFLACLNKVAPVALPQGRRRQHWRQRWHRPQHSQNIKVLQ